MAAASADFVYTVPDGFVLLLKSIYNRPAGTGELGMQAYVFSADESINAFVFDVAPGSQPVPAWEGWLALNAGDHIYIGATGAAMWYWISGALLPYASALPVGAIP